MLWIDRTIINTSGLLSDAIRCGDEGKPSKDFASPVSKPIVRCEPVG